MGLQVRELAELALEEFAWMEMASCWGVALQYPRGKGPFFKEGRGHNYREARIYCSGCPVVIDCLIMALDDEHEGFQGGMSKNERTETRKRLNQGEDFHKIVESVWKPHRHKRYPAVPPSSVWKEWDV